MIRDDGAFTGQRARDGTFHPTIREDDLADATLDGLDC